MCYKNAFFSAFIFGACTPRMLIEKLSIAFFSAFFIGACTTSKKITETYDLVCFNSDIVEENGYFVKRYVLGDRSFTVQIKELTKDGDMFRFKGRVIDNDYDIVPYPYMCLISIEGSKYRIVKKLCIGDVSGNLDCVFKWESSAATPQIAIDAVGYHGAVFYLEPKDSCDTSKHFVQ